LCGAHTSNPIIAAPSPCNGGNVNAASATNMSPGTTRATETVGRLRRYGAPRNSPARVARDSWAETARLHVVAHALLMVALKHRAREGGTCRA
jgi:hypothetical protein